VWLQSWESIKRFGAGNLHQQQLLHGQSIATQAVDSAVAGRKMLGLISMSHCPSQLFNTMACL
jgi:hypothetical protein